MRYANKYKAVNQTGMDLLASSGLCAHFTSHADGDDFQKCNNCIEGHDLRTHSCTKEQTYMLTDVHVHHVIHTGGHKKAE